MTHICKEDLYSESRESSSKFRRKMARISQIFLHSRHQQPEKTNKNNNSIQKPLVCTLKEDSNLQGKPSQKYQNPTLAQEHSNVIPMYLLLPLQTLAKCIRILYKLYHLQMMEIALTKKEQRNNTPPQNISCIMKKTYQIKTTKLVPVFAARWHLF